MCLIFEEQNVLSKNKISKARSKILNRARDLKKNPNEP
jgi:hypothetical protein